MRPRPPHALLGSADEIERQFYEALQRGDIDKLMAVWADDEEIVCVHPGGTRHVGYEAVRGAFEQIFAGDSKLRFRLDQVVMVETVGLALQSAVEHVYAGDATLRGIVVASNVFMRTPSGWRMVCHHASPAPAAPSSAPSGPLH